MLNKIEIMCKYCPEKVIKCLFLLQVIKKELESLISGISISLGGSYKGFKILMYRKTAILPVLMILFMLSACVQSKVDQQLVASPDPVALRLANAVDQASVALKTLASIEQARNPNVQIESVAGAPQELQRVIAIEWIGPIEPIVRKAAEKAGYNFQINGNAPSTPIIISISSREKQVVEVLRDIGLQAGRRADIVVDIESKTVELNYASVSG